MGPSQLLLMGEKEVRARKLNHLPQRGHSCGLGVLGLYCPLPNFLVLWPSDAKQPPSFSTSCKLPVNLVRGPQTEVSV